MNRWIDEDARTLLIATAWIAGVAAVGVILFGGWP